MNQMKLSIVILCYKAGEYARVFVSDTIKSLRANNIDNYQLILVGNYLETNDKTPQVVTELAKNDPCINCVAKPKAGMMGWDMRSGLEIANGDYIAVIDGDGQMPIDDLVKVFNEITKNKFDLVKTFRIKRGDGLKRKILSFGYNFCFNLLFPGVNSSDINSKPKIISRKAYQKLNLQSDDWFIDAEIMIQAKRNNFKIKEIPTSFLGLKGSRKSFVNSITIFEFIRNLIVYRIKEFKLKLK